MSKYYLIFIMLLMMPVSAQNPANIYEYQKSWRDNDSVDTIITFWVCFEYAVYEDAIEISAILTTDYWEAKIHVAIEIFPLTSIPQPIWEIEQDSQHSIFVAGNTSSIIYTIIFELTYTNTYGDNYRSLYDFDDSEQIRENINLNNVCDLNEFEGNRNDIHVPFSIIGLFILPPVAYIKRKYDTNKRI